jgi:hypothetical protein
VEYPSAQVWTVSDGLGVRVEFFPDQAEALEAAGLPEDDIQSDP